MPPPAARGRRAAEPAPTTARRGAAANKGKAAARPAASGASGPRASPLNLQPSSTSRGTQQADNSVGVAAGGRRTARAAAVKASKKVADVYK